MSEKPKSPISELVGAAMELKGYSQAELGRRVGCSGSRINQLFQNTRPTFGLNIAVGLANVLDLSIFDLAAALEVDPYITIVGELQSGDVGIKEFLKSTHKQELKRVPKPPWMTKKDSSIAVRVKGDDLGGRLRNGDLLIFVKVTRPVINGGHFAVELKSKKILYKKVWAHGNIMRLESLHGGEPMDVQANEVEAIYRIATIIPAA